MSDQNLETSQPVRKPALKHDKERFGRYGSPLRRQLPKGERVPSQLPLCPTRQEKDWDAVFGHLPEERKMKRTAEQSLTLSINYLRQYMVI